MGLIGLLVTVLMMVVGTGYLLSGSMRSVTIGNPSSQSSTTNGQPETVQDQKTVAGEIAQGETALDAAKAAKQLVERQAAQTMNEAGQSTADPSSGAPQAGAPQPTTKGSDTGRSLAVTNRLVPFGYAVPSAPRRIDTIVLHSSYDATGNDPYSVAGVIAEWRAAGVAPHYLIDRQGTIYRLVEDKNIAYHAGVSRMPDGRTNVNDFSIGIELLDTKEDAYTDAEYAAVNALITSLKAKYPVKDILGHSDIAPGRKTDPWNLDWKRVKD